MKIIPQGIPSWVEIAESPAHNVKPISMEMHRMIVTRQNIRPLQNHLHARVVLQHHRPRPKLRRQKLPRQIPPRVVELPRRLLGEVFLKNTAIFMIVRLEDVGGGGHEAHVVQAGGEAFSERPGAGGAAAVEEVHGRRDEEMLVHFGRDVSEAAEAPSELGGGERGVVRGELGEERG